MELLTDDQITAELSESPGWTTENGEITQTFERRDFRDALLLVGAVAFLAEKPATTRTSTSGGTRSR